MIDTVLMLVFFWTTIAIHVFIIFYVRERLNKWLVILSMLFPLALGLRISHIAFSGLLIIFYYLIEAVVSIGIIKKHLKSEKLLTVFGFLVFMASVFGIVHFFNRDLVWLRMSAIVLIIITGLVMMLSKNITFKSIKLPLFAYSINLMFFILYWNWNLIFK